jgi:hypothetical protein
VHAIQVRVRHHVPVLITAACHTKGNTKPDEASTQLSDILSILQIDGLAIYGVIVYAVPSAIRRIASAVDET